MNILSLFYSTQSSDEVKKLERLSMIVFLVLSFVIAVASIMMAFCIQKGLLITSGVMAGIVGSATAALLSALQRRASGWELEDGTAIPTRGDDDPVQTKERFSLRMASFFIFRPFLGIIAGLIVYYGGDSLFDLNTEEPKQFKVIIFYCLLAGLFAKTLIEILKGIFKAMFGRG